MKLKRREKAKVVARFKDFKKVLDWWKEVKKNVD